MTAFMDDPHYLPGVSFTVDGEQVPAHALSWAMTASCGCNSGLHMMTEDVVTEAAAWRAMSGNAQMIKQDKARGFKLRLVKKRTVDFSDCTHDPKWGYTPAPTPVGHSWATLMWKSTNLHLIPLTALERDKVKESGREWVEEGDVRQVESVCGKFIEAAAYWTRARHRTDSKVECARCLKLAEAMSSAVSS